MGAAGQAKCPLQDTQHVAVFAIEYLPQLRQVTCKELSSLRSSIIAGHCQAGRSAELVDQCHCVGQNRAAASGMPWASSDNFPLQVQGPLLCNKVTGDDTILKDPGVKSTMNVQLKDGSQLSAEHVPEGSF